MINLTTRSHNLVAGSLQPTSLANPRVIVTCDQRHQGEHGQKLVHAVLLRRMRTRWEHT